MRSRIHSKGKLYYSFILSYIYLLILSLCMALVFYGVSANIVENEIKKAGMASLVQYKNIFDSMFNRVEKIGLQLMVDESVNSIIHAQTMNFHRRYEIFELKNDIGHYFSNDYYVKDAFIYSSKYDFVVSQSGWAEADIFVTAKLGCTNETVEAWKNALVDEKNSDFRLVKKNDKDDYFTFIKHFKDDNSIIGSVVIIIDNDNMMETIETMQWMEQSSVYIFNDRDEIVFTSDSTIDPNFFDEIDFQDKKMEKIYNINDILVLSRTSEMNNFKYIMLIPESAFFKTAKGLRYLIGILTGLCLITGTGLAVYFASRNYKPLKNIIHVFGEEDRNWASNKNEIKYIEDAIKNVISEKKEVENKMKSQSAQLKNQVLRRVLNGQYNKADEITELFNSYEIETKGNLFQVVIFYVENDQSVISDTQKTAHELLNYKMILIKDVFSEALSIEHHCYIVEMGQYFVIITNYDGNLLDKNDIEVDIKKACLLTKQTISSQFGLFISIALGGVYVGIDNIRNSYEQALYAMEYLLLFGKDDIISFDSIKGNKSETNTQFYSFDKERALVSLIQRGDYEGSYKLIDTIFNDLLVSDVTVEYARCTIFAIVNTISNIFIEFSEQGNDDWRKEINIINERLINSKSIEEMRQGIRDSFEKIEEYIKKDRKVDDKISRICKFIESNYTDYNINVSMIADIFEMSTAYLSTSFKNVMGINISDYINNMRLAHAKALLCKEKMTIKKVASLSGFGDSGTFIRVFKKNVGMTPGAYRKNHANSD